MFDFIGKLREYRWVNFFILAVWAFSAIGMSIFVIFCFKANFALIVSDIVLVLTGVPVIKKLLERI